MRAGFGVPGQVLYWAVWSHRPRCAEQLVAAPARRPRLTRTNAVL